MSLSIMRQVNIETPTFRYRFSNICQVVMGQKHSNEVHREGVLMPKACSACLGAVANFDEGRFPGRGAKQYNEYFWYAIHG